jgi:uncharacterized protein YcbK (DUF882 family)
MSFPLNITNLSRRRFIAASAGLVAGIFIASPFKSLASRSQYHSLSFYHTHTGETLNLNFNLKTLRPGNTKKLYHFLRDFRTGDIHPIDTRLIGMLCRLQRQVDSSGTFEVISAYRSPVTNTKLHNASSGVAKKSLHMKGRAIDIRLSDVPTKKLRTVACAMRDGGVGYYAKSDFIHLDTGRFRTW